MSGHSPARATVTVGHWTDTAAETGCTVVLFDRPVLAAVEVRGGAPATRETELLAPGRLVQRVDAILLTGGSAFGLAAADGVVRFLAERDRGFPTSAGPVPIVPAAALFDLNIGQPIAPDAASGRRACQDATPLPDMPRGQVGAGRGARIAKMARSAHTARGGVGLGTMQWPGGAVSAVVAVNAFGDVVDPTTGDRLGPPDQRRIDRREEIVTGGARLPALGGASTLAIVIVDAPCDHDTLLRCATSAHDGFARAIRPCHTPFDGDLVFAVTLAEGIASAHDTLRLSVAAELAVEAAIMDAVTA